MTLCPICNQDFDKQKDGYAKVNGEVCCLNCFIDEDKSPLKKVRQTIQEAIKAVMDDGMEEKKNG